MSPPARFSQEEAALVFRRAAELEAGATSGGTDEGFDREQLVEIGREVGLSAGSVRLAMDEVRHDPSLVAAPPEPAGLAIVLARSVPGPWAEVAFSVESLARRNLLALRRRSSDTTVWTPDARVATSVLRRLSTRTARPLLAVSRLTASLAEGPGRPGEVALTLRAELATPRHRILRFRTQARVGTGVAAGVGGLWLTAVHWIDLVPPHFGQEHPLAALGLVGGTALTWASIRHGVRSYRSALRSTEDALALFLDRLERRSPRFTAVDSVSSYA